MNGLARIFFFADAIFVLIFSVCCLIYANHDVLLIFFVVVGLITVYPLYIFTDVYTGEDSKLTVAWYLEHFNMLLLYCVLRLVMLFGFFSWILIDLSGISVGTVIAHFPVSVIVGIFVMSVMVLILVFCALKLVPLQRAHVYDFVKLHEEEEEDEVMQPRTGGWSQGFYSA